MIGFMANDVLPLRAGELVRAYALSHLTSVRLTTALATTVLEWVWDVIIIGLLLVLVPPVSDCSGEPTNAVRVGS